MTSQIHARKLSTSDINEILINLQRLSTAELRDTIKIMSTDLKNDMRIINNNYDTIDRVNKRYRDTLSERRYLFWRCHELASEVNELKKKLVVLEVDKSQSA